MLGKLLLLTIQKFVTFFSLRQLEKKKNRNISMIFNIHILRSVERNI